MQNLSLGSMLSSLCPLQKVRNFLMILQQSKTIASNPWIVCQKPNPEARLRLFCFSYAGGGAVVFRTWSSHMPPEIELCALQFPGRENRLRETPLNRMALVVDTLAQALQSYLDKPFAFFGHSLGGLICFELAHQLRKAYGRAPKQLFISARRAPQIPEPLPPIHQLPGAEFVAEMRRRYNGIPEAILQTPELLEVMLPMLRADFAIFETYVYAQPEPLPCPIAVFGGQQDQVVCKEDLAAWRKQTRGYFSMQLFPGGHFYLREAQSALLQEISQELKLRLRELDGM